METPINAVQDVLLYTEDDQLMWMGIDKTDSTRYFVYVTPVSLLVVPAVFLLQAREDLCLVTGLLVQVHVILFLFLPWKLERKT